MMVFSIRLWFSWTAIKEVLGSLTSELSSFPLDLKLSTSSTKFANMLSNMRAVVRSSCTTVSKSLTEWLVNPLQRQDLLPCDLSPSASQAANLSIPRQCSAACVGVTGTALVNNADCSSRRCGRRVIRRLTLLSSTSSRPFLKHFERFTPEELFNIVRNEVCKCIITSTNNVNK